MLAVYALLGHPQGSTPTPVLRRELEAALAGAGDGRRDRGRHHADGRPRPGAPAARPHRLGRPARATTSARRPCRSRRSSVARSLAVGAASPSLPLVATWRRRPHRRRDHRGRHRAGPAPAAPSSPTADDRAARRARTAPSPSRSAPRPAPAGPGRRRRSSAGTTRLVGRRRRRRTLGMYVTAPDGRAVYLTQTMWQSYSEISGTEPARLPRVRRLPGGHRRYDDPDAVAIRLDNGGLVIGPREDTQMFWIPAQGVQRWTRARRPARRARLPVLEPAGRPSTAPSSSSSTARCSVAAENVAPLQAGETVPIELVIPRRPDRRAATSMRSATASSASGAASRGGSTPPASATGSPDRTTWSCLGGDAARVPRRRRAAGWTVWLFPLGAPATCAAAPSPPTLGH